MWPEASPITTAAWKGATLHAVKRGPKVSPLYKCGGINGTWVLVRCFSESNESRGISPLNLLFALSFSHLEVAALPQ